jgi:hypothetical protein
VFTSESGADGLPDSTPHSQAVKRFARTHRFRPQNVALARLDTPQHGRQLVTLRPLDALTSRCSHVLLTSKCLRVDGQRLFAAAGPAWRASRQAIRCRTAAFPRYLAQHHGHGDHGHEAVAARWPAGSPRSCRKPTPGTLRVFLRPELARRAALGPSRGRSLGPVRFLGPNNARVTRQSGYCGDSIVANSPRPLDSRRRASRREAVLRRPCYPSAAWGHSSRVSEGSWPAGAESGHGGIEFGHLRPTAIGSRRLCPQGCV